MTPNQISRWQVKPFHKCPWIGKSHSIGLQNPTNKKDDKSHTTQRGMVANTIINIKQGGTVVETGYIVVSYFVDAWYFGYPPVFSTLNESEQLYTKKGGLHH